MNNQDPFGAWETGRHGQQALELRRQDRGGIFLSVIDERKPGSTQCRIGSRWYTNFGSAEVLGLDREPFFAPAILSGVGRWGTGCGASRVYQTMRPCIELEQGLARITRAQDAIVFNSATTAHFGLIPGMARFGKASFLLDSAVHNSVQRACEIAHARGAEVSLFRHNNLDDLQSIIDKCQTIPIIAVDSIYSMTGEFAPLKELREIASEHNGYLYVDDAHGTGLYGDLGGGYATSVFGTIPDNVFVAGSMSKALCGYGGFLACTARVRTFIECTGDGFLFNGPVPSPYLEANTAITTFLESDGYGTAMEKLRSNQRKVRSILLAAGFQILAPDSHILAVSMDSNSAIELGRKLFAGGILANVAMYPAVQRGRGIVRLTPTAKHTDEDIAMLAKAIY